jgi:hypothetical protein
MDLSNPYAPPQAALDGPIGSSQGQVTWQLQGDLLIAQKGSVLPNICIFSGQPTEGQRVNRKLQWSPQWTIMLGGVLFMLIFRKTGYLDYALGEVGRKRKKSAILMVLAGVGAMVLAIAIGVAAEQPAMIAVGTLAFFVLMVVGLVRAQPFRLLKIDKTHIHIKLRPEAAQAFARVAK